LDGAFATLAFLRRGAAFFGVAAFLRRGAAFFGVAAFFLFLAAGLTAAFFTPPVGFGSPSSPFIN
jgi:hypothetical protein